MYYNYNYKTIVIEKWIVVSYLSVCVQVCQLYSIRDLHTTQILSGTITFSLPSQYWLGHGKGSFSLWRVCKQETESRMTQRT